MSDATEKMRSEGLPDIAIDTFSRYEDRLRAGEQGLVPESEIEPLAEVPSLSELDEGDASAIERVVVLKLNGGLGTSMGMTKAKSLLEVKDGHSFLDVIARQILQLREQHGARIPLLLMNSFATREDTLAALDELPRAPGRATCHSTSSRAGCRSCSPTGAGRPSGPPTRRSSGRRPATATCSPRWPRRACSPSCSNAATSTSSCRTPTTSARRSSRASSAGWRARGCPFVSEVVDRTESDRKGGHLARRRSDGGLLLRETAQVPDDDQAAFEDIEIHSYFNANNIWVSLHALDEELREGDGVLELPMIVNRKTVDPRDSSSPEVVQLETAMGAAIGAFEGAGAVHVPRERFVPVKKTSDLLVVRSDAYRLGEDWSVRLAPGARRPPAARRARLRATTSWSATSTSASPRGRPRSPPARDSRSTGT